MNYATLNPLAAFVNPGFAWAGVALLAIPILIHILNRRRFKVVRWAAMEYLLQAMRKNRRRLKFEQWLLLAMRCAVLGLLGLALARPMGCADSTLASLAGQRTGVHVFLIDNSYSMAYQADRPGARTHLDHARNLSRTLIDRLVRGGESVAIISAAAPATAVIARGTYDLDAAKAAIGRIEQSAASTDLPGAMNLALQIARDDTSSARRRLYLFTDGTRSAWTGTAAAGIEQASAELGKVYRITHFNLGKPGQWNHAVLDVRPETPLVTTKLNFNSPFHADVKGYGPGPAAALRWKVDDSSLLGGSGEIQLEPDTPRQTQSQVAMKTAGPHVVSVALGSADRLPVDDVRRRVVDAVGRLRVLIVEGDKGLGLMAGSAAFLGIALAPANDPGQGVAGTDSYVAPEIVSDLELANKVLGDYRAVVICNVGQISPAEADRLGTFVRRGGALLWFMGEQINSRNYNDVLLPRGLLPGPLTRRMSAAGDDKGFQFDFRPSGSLHPLLGIFRGEQRSGLDTARIFTYLQIEIPAQSKVERVLDYLTGGDPSAKGTANDPAITAHSLGDGRVVWFSTTANAEWTSLPAKPAYVTLMHELLAGSVSSGDGWMNLTVGQALQTPASLKLLSAPMLLDTQRREYPLIQTTDEAGQVSHRSGPLTRPGVYTLVTGAESLPIVVNPPSDEADVRVLDDAGIKKAMGGVEVELEADQIPPEILARQSGNDFGWSLMAIVLCAAALECLLAMRFGHHRVIHARGAKG